MRVLRTAGTPDESAEPYSGLHLLLRPLRDQIPSCREPQRDALDVAFGVRDGDPPTTFLAGVAALTLLSDAASAHPLLVIGEDLHWLDPASRQTLLMVARRVSSDPMLVVMTARGGHDAVEADMIERLHLAPLSFIDANAVLDTRPDRPEGADRRVLLELADGNALALVELRSLAPARRRLQLVPLTHRLELAFAGRYAELSPAARLGVLAAALGCESIEDATARWQGRSTVSRPATGWDGGAAGLVEPVQGGGLGVPASARALGRSERGGSRSNARSLLRALVDTISGSLAHGLVAGRPGSPALTPTLAAELGSIGDAGLAGGRRRRSRCGRCAAPRS